MVLFPLQFETGEARDLSSLLRQRSSQQHEIDNGAKIKSSLRSKARLRIDRGGPPFVLAVLPREEIDQALDAMVADFLGESVSISSRKAHAADLDVVDLPSRRGLLHVVVDGNRLSARLLDFRPDAHLLIAGLGAQGLEIDNLVTVVGERGGIRAHQKRPKFPDELLALLGAGAPPVGAHRDPGRMRKIEVGQDLRLNEARDLVRITG